MTKTNTVHHKSTGFSLNVEAPRRRVMVRMTKETMDREREVLVVDGMDTTDFMRNPIVMVDHRYNIESTVGKVLSIKRANGEAVAEVEVLPSPDGYKGDWIGDTVLHLAAHGIMGVSVGFQGKERRRATQADKKQWGEEVEAVYGKWKLVELSFVPIPANQDALILNVQKGILSPVVAKQFFDMDMPEPKAKKIVEPAPLKIKRSPQFNAKIDSFGRVLARQLGKSYY